ncbi:hypothetical protein V6N13_086529 [Hibiscus sabdariffa]
MARFSFYHHCFIKFLSFILLVFLQGATAATFTFINRCHHTIWPGILANPGSPKLESTGFELTKGSSRSFQVPSGWSGRFWGRTGCVFDDSGQGSCTTGDCGSGQVECNGAGATPPATLAEFTLGSGAQDFYDVSLVDGYNLPLLVQGSGGSGDCATTGCVTNLNKKCPSELRIHGGGACRSACEAFGNPEYCCKDAYNTPAACKPSMYSEVFKAACPKSYSYAFDDASSTFTCTGADYTITFCPGGPILKTFEDLSPKTTGTTVESKLDHDPVKAAEEARNWLANLATGDSATTQPSSPIQFGFACSRLSALLQNFDMGVSLAVFPCGFFLLLFINFSTGSQVVTVDVTEAKHLLQSGHVYVDVRTVEEFRKGHVEAEKIINIPYMFSTPEGMVKNPEFLKEVSSAFKEEDRLVVGCKSGVRSLSATADLLKMGFKDVRNLGGGYLAWVDNGFSTKMEEPATARVEQEKPKEEL